MSFQRRAYEERAVSQLADALKSKRHVLAVGPTGSGKTVVAAMLIKRLGGRVLFLAHRYELVDQAYKALAAMGLRPGVIMAQDEGLHDRSDPDAPVQVGSVQTIGARGIAKRTGLIVFDEAHRVMSDSYQRIAAMAPEARVLGLTATPIRMDGRSLGDFFETLVTIAKPSELYEGGYLSRPRIWGAPAGVLKELGARLRGVGSSDGDYAPGKLAVAVSTKRLIGNVVSESIRLAPHVPKVVFAAGVEHSRSIVKGFRKAGVKAEHLDGQTDALERERIIGDLAAGRIEVISNVDVLSEGWDLPSLGAIAIARPTKSKSRYLQMCGRVQRPFEGKEPRIIDHGNCAIRLQLFPDDDIDWSLDAEPESAAGKEVVKQCVECARIIAGGCRTCPKCGADQPATEAQRKAEVEAQLEELDQKRREEVLARARELAKKKGAPDGWAERSAAVIQLVARH